MAFLVMVAKQQDLSVNKNGMSQQIAYPMYTGLFLLIV